MPPGVVDVAIIGAGPYGLGLAAHLAERGVNHRIVGPPMQAWRSMSPGMYLKSFGFATSIRVPQANATLPEYCRARGSEDYEPIAISTFADYGLWIQQQCVPDVEPWEVTGLQRQGGQFLIRLETEETFLARRTVIAIGLSYFEHIPLELSGVPPHLLSHTCAHADFAEMADTDVTVIGAGQSALQAVALLHEQGARARLLARGRVKWGWSTPRDAQRSLVQRVRVPPSVLGPGRDNWVLEHVPALMHHLPARRRAAITERYLGPSGAWWLRDRVEGKVPVQEGARVVSAEGHGDRVHLRVCDASGREREVLTDRVIAGTGYRVDLSKVPFLGRELVGGVRHRGGAPVLSRHFETSVRGLYFIGPASAASFGPLFRFVAGSAYTVRHLARHLAQTRSATDRHPVPGRLRGSQAEADAGGQ